MKRIVLFVAMSIAMMATATAQQSAPPKTTLEFDAQQLQWLGQAIQELPKKIADPFLADLNGQIAAHQKVAADKAKADADAKKAADAKAKATETGPKDHKKN